MSDDLTRRLMRARAPNDSEAMQEAVLDLGVTIDIEGTVLMKASGRLQMAFEGEFVPDELLDLKRARIAVTKLGEAFKRYDAVKATVKARAGMAGSATGEFPEGDA